MSLLWASPKYIGYISLLLTALTSSLSNYFSICLFIKALSTHCLSSQGVPVLPRCIPCAWSSIRQSPLPLLRLFPSIWMCPSSGDRSHDPSPVVSGPYVHHISLDACTCPLVSEIFSVSDTARTWPTQSVWPSLTQTHPCLLCVCFQDDTVIQSCSIPVDTPGNAPLLHYHGNGKLSPFITELINATLKYVRTNTHTQRVKWHTSRITHRGGEWIIKPIDT